MNKAKTFKLGVSPTRSTGGASSLGSRPRPCFGGCSTRQRQYENITNTHVTQSDLGNRKGAGQVEEDIISPSKRLGFGFICE